MPSSKISLVNVRAGDRRYVVAIGRKLPTAVYRRIIHRLKPRRVFLVCDANFYALHGPALERHWRKAAPSVETVVLPAGESQKRMKAIEMLHDEFIKCRMSREDLIVSCGGGVTSDITGFSAATLYRGVRWGICATTLLGMADASIGGKTGVNHAMGKNLIGAYWQPSFVIDDIEWLTTLPGREFRSGVAEIVKTAGLAGGTLLRVVSRWADESFDPRHSELAAILKATAAHKAKVVARDERDRGPRLHLNFGHTIGHAIEHALSYKRLTHGEAILLGMIGAMTAAGRLGLARTDRLADFRRIVTGALISAPKILLNSDRILEGMRLDKKRSHGKFRFVLLTEPGRPIVRDVSESVIRASIGEMIRVYRNL